MFAEDGSVLAAQAALQLSGKSADGNEINPTRYEQDRVTGDEGFPDLGPSDPQASKLCNCWRA